MTKTATITFTRGTGKRGQRTRGWYWTLRAPNNRVLAVGAEPFTTLSSARRGFLTLVRVIVGVQAWTDVEMDDAPEIREVVIENPCTRRRQRRRRRA